MGGTRGSTDLTWEAERHASILSASEEARIGNGEHDQRLFGTLISFASDGDMNRRKYFHYLHQRHWAIQDYQAKILVSVARHEACGKLLNPEYRKALFWCFSLPNASDLFLPFSQRFGSPMPGTWLVQFLE